MRGILQTLSELGVVPVVTIDRAEDGVPLAEALVAGGLPCAEITYRTAAAGKGIRSITTEFPSVLVGAGTVLIQDQAERAVEAGARFVVSPGFDPSVVEWCLEHGVSVIPGVATPTDVQMGLTRGLNTFKFFPAEALGGPRTLKALSGPFGGVKFMPMGGISPGNLAEYLRLPAVDACGGSWVASRDLISKGDFAEVTRLAREAIDIVRRVREEAN